MISVHEVNILTKRKNLYQCLITKAVGAVGF